MKQGTNRQGDSRNPRGDFQFNRMELAGSLGDLGTLLPLAVGMIMVNGLSPAGIFFSIGLFYIFSGAYFRVTCPVEPMKVISGYAIATGITATQVQASCLWIFVLLLMLGATGLINAIGRSIPKAVIRGIQLSTGILLLSQGVRFILGTSSLQLLQKSAEPNLVIQSIASLPIGIVLGVGLGLITLLLLDNRRLPAAVVVVGAGIVIGILFGSREGWGAVQFGISLPTLLPYGQLTWNDFSFALLVLVIPQVPMTVGNAVIANADLSAQYFPDSGRRVTYRGLSLSMALASLVSFLFGGMPMCHGAGGLASRYRFGARTAGSNLIIGGIFFGIALFFAEQIMPLVNMLPLAVLGVLLIFAGAQLALTILDMQTRKELFVVILIVGITLAANLAVGFITGIVVATLLRWERFSV